MQTINIFDRMKEAISNMPHEGYKKLMEKEYDQHKYPNVFGTTNSKEDKSLKESLDDLNKLAEDLTEDQIEEVKQEVQDYINAQDMLVRMLDPNLHNIPRAFATARERGWDKIFVFADIHDTVLAADFGNIAHTYEPMAKEVLQKISQRKDVCLCLYTCSYPKEIEVYLEEFRKDGIEFIYTNENPEAENTKHGYFRDKPYMNILFEDKAGFKSKIDWYIIDQLFDQEESLS